MGPFVRVGLHLEDKDLVLKGPVSTSFYCDSKMESQGPSSFFHFKEDSHFTFINIVSAPSIRELR
jgi:hypothetical protein